jgi:hypothetical protein
MADITLSQGAVYKFISTGSSEFQFIGGQNVPFQYDFLHSIFITSSQDPFISIKSSLTDSDFLKMTSTARNNIYYIREDASDDALCFANKSSVYHFAISGSTTNGPDRQTLFNSYIALDNQSADPSIKQNHAHIYAKDDSAVAEVYVQDESGNVTKISPHNEEGDWEYFSRNKITGKTIRINMEHFVKRMEEITGEVFIKYE